jgi:hypothetical protein
MPASDLRFIKKWAEYQEKSEYVKLPRGTRGIYALLNRVMRSGAEKYDVVYIGMARGTSGVRGRLRSHERSKRKGKLWSHFSVFEVWDNITEDEIIELEGLFRHIYRKDTQANRVNRQRSFKKLRPVKKNRLSNWKDGAPPKKKRRLG